MTKNQTKRFCVAVGCCHQVIDRWVNISRSGYRKYILHLPCEQGGFHICVLLYVIYYSYIWAEVNTNIVPGKVFQMCLHCGVQNKRIIGRLAYSVISVQGTMPLCTNARCIWKTFALTRPIFIPGQSLAMWYSSNDTNIIM